MIEHRLRRLSSEAAAQAAVMMHADIEERIDSGVTAYSEDVTSFAVGDAQLEYFESTRTSFYVPVSGKIGIDNSLKVADVDDSDDSGVALTNSDDSRFHDSTRKSSKFGGSADDCWGSEYFFQVTWLCADSDIRNLLGSLYGRSHHFAMGQSFFPCSFYINNVRHLHQVPLFFICPVIIMSVLVVTSRVTHSSLFVMLTVTTIPTVSPNSVI